MEADTNKIVAEICSFDAIRLCPWVICEFIAYVICMGCRNISLRKAKLLFPKATFFAGVKKMSYCHLEVDIFGYKHKCGPNN
jgi:hypothetical protein